MTDTKERVRVQAGRQGAPKSAALPAVRSNGAPTLSPEPTSMLAVIARAAADPNVNTEKMEALLRMQRDIEDRDAKKAFTTAFIALQKHLPSIKRDGKIEIREKDQTGQRSGRVQQATPYATFNAIMKVIAKPLQNHGFSLSFATEPAADGRILVKGLLEHEQGHSRETVFPLPAEVSGSKNNVQGWGSSLSYGKRYCTIALLNIVSHAAEDADTDGNEGNFKHATGGKLIDAEPIKMISKAQVEELLNVLEDCGLSEKRFCQTMQIQKLEELREDLFETAKARCRTYKAEKAERDAKR